MRFRGQTSVEVLLVISFVLLLVLGIILPYVSNQNITNAALAAKISILPFIEKNSLRAKINSIDPEVAGSEITLHITTTAAWDQIVYDELNFGTPISGCVRVCNSVYALGAYSRVYIDWVDSGFPFCGGLFYCDSTTVGVSSPNAYVNEDIVSSSLSHNFPASFTLAPNSTADIGVSVLNQVALNSGYDELSTFQVNVICKVTQLGDACSSITPDAAGYTAFISAISASPNSSIFIPSTMRLVRYGSTPSDTLFPQLYSGLLSQYSAGGATGQVFSTDIEDGSTPSFNYHLDPAPTAMNLRGGLYRFISVTYRAHFNYLTSTPPVFNREEHSSFQGNNIQVIPFSI